jgi:hypothetical protein
MRRRRRGGGGGGGGEEEEEEGEEEEVDARGRLDPSTLPSWLGRDWDVRTC